MGTLIIAQPLQTIKLKLELINEQIFPILLFMTGFVGISYMNCFPDIVILTIIKDYTCIELVYCNL